MKSVGKLLKGLAFFALALVVLIVLVSAVMYSFFPKETLKTWMLETAREHGVEIVFESAQVQWGLPLALVFKKPVFESLPEGGLPVQFSGKAVEIRVAMDWWQSLRSMAAHGKIQFIEPDITVETARKRIKGSGGGLRSLEAPTYLAASFGMSGGLAEAKGSIEILNGKVQVVFKNATLLMEKLYLRVVSAGRNQTTDIEMSSLITAGQRRLDVVGSCAVEKQPKESGELGIRSLSVVVEKQWMFRKKSWNPIVDGYGQLFLNQIRVDPVKGEIHIDEGYFEHEKKDRVLISDGKMSGYSGTLALTSGTFDLKKIMRVVGASGPQELAGIVRIEEPAKVSYSHAKEGVVAVTQIDFNTPRLVVENLVLKNQDWNWTTPRLSVSGLTQIQPSRSELRLKGSRVETFDLAVPFDGVVAFGSKKHVKLAVGNVSIPLSKIPSHVWSKWKVKDPSGTVTIKSPFNVSFFPKRGNQWDWRTSGEMKVRNVSFSHGDAQIQNVTGTVKAKGQTFELVGKASKLTAKRKAKEPLKLVDSRFKGSAKDDEIRLRQLKARFLGEPLVVSGGKLSQSNRKLHVEAVRLNHPNAKRVLAWLDPRTKEMVDSGKLRLKVNGIRQGFDVKNDPIPKTLRGKVDARITEFRSKMIRDKKQKAQQFVERSVKALAILKVFFSKRKKEKAKKRKRTSLGSDVYTVDLRGDLIGTVLKVSRLRVYNKDGELRGKGSIDFGQEQIVMDMEYEVFKTDLFLGSDLRELLTDERGHLLVPFKLQGLMKQIQIKFLSDRFLKLVRPRIVERLMRRDEKEQKENGEKPKDRVEKRKKRRKDIRERVKGVFKKLFK